MWEIVFFEFEKRITTSTEQFVQPDIYVKL